jgi:transcription elongation factor GreA
MQPAGRVDKRLALTYNAALLSGGIRLSSRRRKVFVSRKEVILTEDGLKQLTDEVNFLSTVKREEVAERIRAAREFGDIMENSEYDDAKNEQALLEHRIGLLQEKLRRARVIKDSEIGTDRVGIGSTVTIRDKDTKEKRVYTLVGSAEADPANARLSNESPVGQAILGKQVGDVVTVPAPVGAVNYEIVAIGKMQ